ncbi:hypothetical protein F385_931 [Pantoea agglomerans 299R]|nr:hypothetical protein F385_931 [Pantoea agglomerans 299R]
MVYFPPVALTRPFPPLNFVYPSLKSNESAVNEPGKEKIDEHVQYVRGSD